MQIGIANSIAPRHAHARSGLNRPELCSKFVALLRGNRSGGGLRKRVTIGRLGGMSSKNLAEQIDKLVRAHLTQVRAEAIAAVEQAFASSTSKVKAPRAPKPQKPRAPGKRRDPALMAEVAESLLEVDLPRFGGHPRKDENGFTSGTEEKKTAEIH